MNEVEQIQRQTKYCQAIEQILCNCGHATNAELLKELRKEFPELSATTVHRATARLAERGLICSAPPAQDGSKRYDANTKPHDHFVCQGCDVIKDADIKDKVVPALEGCLDGCKISGRLTISGNCKDCANC